MNHVVINPGPGEMGYGCKCGQRFPTQKPPTYMQPTRT